MQHFMCECCNIYHELCNALGFKTNELCNVKTNSQIKHIKMKKLKFFIMTALIMLSFIPSQMNAETVKSTSPAVTTKTVESTDVNVSAATAADAKAEAQLARLEEIRAMDMSELTPSEKKELREEVHAIQNEQDHDRFRDNDRRDNDGPRHHHRGGVVFLGGGGLLLIILILLLL